MAHKTLETMSADEIEAAEQEAEARAAEGPHYHYECFHVGCLNDYQSGPYASQEECEQAALEYTEEWDAVEADADPDYEHERFQETPPNRGQTKRWQRGTVVVAVTICEELIAHCEAWED